MENQKAKLQNWKKKRKQNTWGKKGTSKREKHWKKWICPFAFSLHLFCFLDVSFLLLGCFCFCFLAWKKTNKQKQNQSKKNKSKKQNKCKKMQMDKLVHCFPIFSPLFPLFDFPFFSCFPFFPLLFCFCVFWILLMCFLFVPCFFCAFVAFFFQILKQVGISYGLVDIILFLIPVFPASLLFCCSCFSVFVAFLLLCSFCFSAFPLFAFPASLFFCSFSSVPFYCSTTFSCSAVMRFCCSASFCSFASLLPSLLSLCFSFPFALFSPACILNEVLEKP